MLSGPIEGTLLQMLATTARARRILEVGMFTGFSALMMAAVLPDDGKLITCEIDPKAIAFAKAFFARSPDGHKIEVREARRSTPCVRSIRPLSWCSSTRTRRTTSTTTRPRCRCWHRTG
jgi:predicted O-methyltransferase YrrM